LGGLISSANGSFAKSKEGFSSQPRRLTRVKLPAPRLAVMMTTMSNPARAIRMKQRQLPRSPCLYLLYLIWDVSNRLLLREIFEKKGMQGVPMQRTGY
jgi:hypothetical protein